MLSLVAGRYPAGPGEVAMTKTVASELHLSVGEVWHEGGNARRLVGIVLNPESLLDEFALVVPGQVTSPSLVTVFFDAKSAGHLPANVQSAASVSKSNAFNPETISIAGLTIGMILIALVAVGGFTVLAQRRLRSLGMLESLGATDAHVGLVVRADGAIVGAVGSVLGAVVGIGIWLAYRPHLEQSSHHLIATFALSWPVVAAAIVLAVVAAARFANVLDYAGPNLTSNQLVVYTPNGSSGDIGPGLPPPSAPSAGRLHEMASAADDIGKDVGTHHVIELLPTSATLLRAASGSNFSGPVYVATPQVLSAFGITASQVHPGADVLTMRPGLSSLTKMQIVYGNYPLYGPHPRESGKFACPKSDCLANPKIQEMSALPSGTSAPNTVITERAVHRLGLRTVVAGWLIQSTKTITAAQISSAQVTAASAGLSVETKNGQPTSAEIIDYAVVFGTLLALAILALSVGLIRSETASDLRILTATGASSTTRRAITATTTGALAFAGAIFGTATAYLAVIGYLRANTLNGGLGALESVPVWDLVAVLILMPLAATLGGWILGGRQPEVISRQPIE